jgi:hypothetical protein
MMQPPGRPPGEMAMMGLANGAQMAQRQQQPQMPQPQGQANGFLQRMFAGGGQQPQKPMGAFQFPMMGGGQ